MKTIYPPRPKGAIPPEQLPNYEDGKWVAQYKYNGARNVIHIKGNDVSVIGRHGKEHSIYSLTNNTKDELLSLPGLIKGEEYWLDSEVLIKTKAEDTKGKIIIFDVLQAGNYLFMKGQMDRLSILNKICGNPAKFDPWRSMGLLIDLQNGRTSKDVLMAPTFFDNFQQHFKEVEGDEVEGLVLRKKNSTLDNFGTKEYKISWIVRCRREHKNYSF